mgnify:CR=1 FL=1
MSRAVRRVPKDWKHPTEMGPNGVERYRPMFGRSLSAATKRWDEENEKWQQGLARDYGTDDNKWGPKLEKYADMSFSEYDGDRPDPARYMPEWPDSERTHLQMYETTSEGTPISPVMETPEELARWLVYNQASAFAGITATYEQWLKMIVRGWAPSAYLDGHGIKPGVP